MEELKKELLKICNSSELPLEAIYYVVKDLYRDVDDVYRKTMEKLSISQEQEEKEKKENDN